MARKRSRNKQTRNKRSNEPKQATPEKATPTPRQAPPASPKTDGFEELDDFFFGSETGQFTRDDFDYDPFEDHSINSGVHRSVDTRGDLKATRMEDIPPEVEAKAKEMANEKAAAKKQAAAEAKAKKQAEEKAAAEAKKQAAAEAKAKKQAEEKAAAEKAAAAEAKAKKEAEEKAAQAEQDKIAAREAEEEEIRKRQTAAELEARGVPLRQRRAAGSAAAAEAAEAEEDLIVTGEVEDEEDDRRSTNPGVSVDEGAPPPPVPAEDGDWSVAAQELAAEAAAARDNKDAERCAVLEYEVGRVLSAWADDAAAAKGHFEAALQAKPDFVPALRELVQMAVARKDWDEAVSLLGKQAEATSDPVGKTAALLASAHFQLTEQRGKQEAAAKVLSQAVDVHAENYTALRFLRVIHYDREEYAPLIDVLTKARALAGTGEQLRLDYEIGRVYDEVLQDSKSALEAFRRALAEDGRLIPAFLYAEQLLTSNGDKAGLVELWRAAADSWGDADVSWWRSRAARLGEMAGADADAVAGDWKAAVDSSAVPDFLAEEYRHWLESKGRTDELAAAIEQGLEVVSEGRQRAALCTTLGEVALAAGETEKASEWFDKALEADASCVIAREGRRRVPAASKDWAAAIAQLDTAAEAATSTRVKLALCMKRAEVALDRQEDPAGARAHLEAAVELAPNYLPAVDSLAQVLIALAEDVSAAERLEQASNLVDSEAARATYLLRAARSWMKAGDAGKASELLGKAAENQPGLLLAREWQAEAFIAQQKWADAAAVLKTAAGETEDAALRVCLLYRSARLSLARAEDEGAARDTYRELLGLVPDFLPATMDLRDLAASGDDAADLAGFLEQEAEAARDNEIKAWWNIAAGRQFEKAGNTDDALARYRAALSAVHGHPVAHAALRRVYRASGDWSALATDLKDQLAAADDAARRDALRLQLISALEQLGEPAAVASEVVQLLESDARTALPLPSLGILCEGLQAWDQAVAVYAAAGAQEGADDAQRAACLFQQGLLREEGLEDQDGAADLYTQADELVGHHPMALENLETIYGNRGDRQGLARVYGRQAERAGSRPVQTFYALLAGDEQERIGNLNEAIAAYTMAFEDPVGRQRAYEALRRIALKSGDAERLRDVTSQLAGDGKDTEALSRWMELGDGLVSIGALDDATAAYQEVVERDASYLSAWYHLERLQGDREEWNSVLAALEGIGEHASTDTVKKAVASRTETLLEEKGVTSDSAQDFYTKRLKSEPMNVVALRGLAGIAMARGETKEAKKHYEALVKAAKEPTQLAEAEAQLGAIALEGKSPSDDKAIEHFEKALEHVPAWRAATNGLRTVYERTENWKALVGVVARESTAAPERRVELHAEIARLWQDKIGESKIAVASWQKVLKEQPGHEEALTRLLGLYEEAEDWGKYLDVADEGLSTLDGDALRDRNAELGIVAHERAGQTDRAIAYLNASIAPEVPSIPGLETLRRISRALGESDRVVKLTVRQADHTKDKAGRVELYVEAAKIRLDEMLDRDGAASLFEKALALDDSCVPAIEFFVSWYYDAGDWAKAAPVFASFQPTVEARDLEDDDERMDATAFYFKFGKLLVAMGDPEGTAIEKYTRALELTPTHLPSLEAAAPRYLAAERWQEARDTCRSILRLRGGIGDAEAMTDLYLNLGQAETKLGDTKNSLKRFKKALDLSQNNVDALLGIAGVHEATGEWNALLSTYNSIIKYARDPDQVIRAYLTKGDVLERKLAIVDKAVLHYEKVLMYDKNNVSAMTRLGQIALKKGDASAAGDFADRAIESARDDNDKRMGLLLKGIVDGGDSVDVGKLVKSVAKEAGDGSVLEAFSAAADGKTLNAAKAAEAYAQATTSV